MRPIDADALKEDLTRFYAGEVTARDLIDKQPTVGGWISVKDRLPEAGKHVLADCEVRFFSGRKKTLCLQSVLRSGSHYQRRKFPG